MVEISLRPDRQTDRTKLVGLLVFKSSTFYSWLPSKISFKKHELINLIDVLVTP